MSMSKPHIHYSYRWLLSYLRPCDSPSKFSHFAWNSCKTIRLWGFCVYHVERTITSKKQANGKHTNHKTRETISNDGHQAAVYRHEDLCKALIDGVDPGLLRNPCFCSIVGSKEGEENNRTVTKIARFQANIGRRRSDDAAQE